MPRTQPVAWFSRTETLVVGRFQVVKALIFFLKKAFARMDEQQNAAAGLNTRAAIERCDGQAKAVVELHAQAAADSAERVYSNSNSN
jgi:hypothetical protein